MNNELKNKMWELIDNNKEELLALASELIKIPSENPNGDIIDVIDYISSYLDNELIHKERVSINEKFPNIVATFGGNNSKTLILNGHADVVPVGDRNKWNFDPFSGEITDSKILGRGASDMKAGLAGILFVVKLLAMNSITLNGSVKLHVVSDEETGGDFGTKWLVDEGYTKDAIGCLVAEPTSYSNCEVGQKGSLWINMKSYGKSAHGSIGQYVGDNAITKLIKVLSEIEKMNNIKGKYSQNQLKVLEDSKYIAKQALKAEGVENVIDHVAVNIGTISGGIKTNMVPDYCESAIDMRLPIGITTNEIIDKIDEIIKDLDITGVEYDFKWNSDANFTDVDNKLVKSAVANAQEIWGKPVIPAYQWASSDARYYRYKDIPTIQYGPANTEGIHSYNEDVDIEDVINSAKVYVGIILDLLGD